MRGSLVGLAVWVWDSRNWLTCSLKLRPRKSNIFRVLLSGSNEKFVQIITSFEVCHNCISLRISYLFVFHNSYYFLGTLQLNCLLWYFSLVTQYIIISYLILTQLFSQTEKMRLYFSLLLFSLISVEACPAGWSETAGDYCYLVSSLPMDWNSAQLVN